MTHQVQFPNLGISVEVNPIAFQVGNFTIYWYGIIIGIGSVITIVTVGDAMTNSVTAVFNDMGANSFQLFLSDKPDENGALNYNRSYEAEDYLNDDILSLYTERFADEIETGPSPSTRATAGRRWAAARPTHGLRRQRRCPGHPEHHPDRRARPQRPGGQRESTWRWSPRACLRS